MDLKDFYKKEFDCLSFIKNSKVSEKEMRYLNDTVSGLPVFQYSIGNDFTITSDLPITHYTLVDLVQRKGFIIDSLYV